MTVLVGTSLLTRTGVCGLNVDYDMASSGLLLLACIIDVFWFILLSTLMATLSSAGLTYSLRLMVTL